MATVPQNRWCFHVFRLKAEHGLLTILVRIGRYISLYHTPLRQFSKPDCSATKNVPRPNDPSSESSREDAYNADLCGTVWYRHFSNCRGDIDHGTSTQGGVILIVWCAPLYQVYGTDSNLIPKPYRTEHTSNTVSVCYTETGRKKMGSVPVLHR